MKREIGKRHSMLPSIQISEAQRENPQDKALAELEKLFSAAASIDAIKIFYAAKDGIKSSTQAIRELDLTQKKYYTHLKKLIDVGLVERIDGAYRHTTLGKIGFKMCQSLMNASNQREKLSLVDKLMKSNTFSEKEKENVLSAISNKELLGTASLADVIHEVRMIEDHDCLINEVIKLLKNAKESVYIAAHESDMRVVDAMADLVERGVKFFYLGDERKNLSERIQVFKMIMNPELVKTM